MMFSTANFSKMLLVVLFPFTSCRRECQFMVSSTQAHRHQHAHRPTQASSARSAPRRLLSPWLCSSAGHQPLQQHLPETCTDARDGVKQDLRNTWPARTIQPQRLRGCSHWGDIHPIQNCISLKARRAGQWERAEIGAGDWKYISYWGEELPSPPTTARGYWRGCWERM